MAADASVLNNTNADIFSPQEVALQSLCKQILKSRLFRGFYEERRYVEEVKGYRDIVNLHKSEKDLNKVMKDIRTKLQLVFQPQNPNKWIGITCGTLIGSAPSPAASDTYIWTEMDDLAFGQYWFFIKTLKFRNNEVIIRLKVVRPVAAEEMTEMLSNSPLDTPRKKVKGVETSFGTQQQNSKHYAEADSSSPLSTENQVNLRDFVELLEKWWSSTKQVTYHFMAHDINRQSITSFLRFLGLLIVSIISGAFISVKFLGTFTIRLLFELSRLTHVLTPIILKILDIFNKIVGGFFILFAMMWKDTIGRRLQHKPAALEYNRPIYHSIEYDIRRRRQISISPTVQELREEH